MANGKSLVSKILKYTAIFEPVEEGGFVVSVPALPGCVTQGESFEEATEIVQVAISGYLGVLEEENLFIPTEKEEAVVTKVSVEYPYQVAY